MPENLSDYITDAMLALLFALCVTMTILDFRRRARMTPEERAREDEDIHNDMHLW